MIRGFRIKLILYPDDFSIYFLIDSERITRGREHTERTTTIYCVNHTENETKKSVIRNLYREENM